MKQSTGPRSQRPKTPSQQKPGQSRIPRSLARTTHPSRTPHNTPQQAVQHTGRTTGNTPRTHQTRTRGHHRRNPGILPHDHRTPRHRLSRRLRPVHRSSKRVRPARRAQLGLPGPACFRGGCPSAFAKSKAAGPDDPSPGDGLLPRPRNDRRSGAHRADRR
jgi:hypothetical protein